MSETQEIRRFRPLNGAMLVNIAENRLFLLNRVEADLTHIGCLLTGVTIYLDAEGYRQASLNGGTWVRRITDLERSSAWGKSFSSSAAAASARAWSLSKRAAAESPTRSLIIT